MENSIGNLIIKVNSALSNYLNKSFSGAGLDLHTQQMVILMILWEKDGQRQQNIANRTNKDKTSVARLLAGMEKNGFIKRRVDSKDSRQKLIYLTDRSRQLMPQILTILRNDFQSLQANINKDDLNTCIRVLSHVHLNLTTDNLAEAAKN